MASIITLNYIIDGSMRAQVLLEIGTLNYLNLRFRYLNFIPSPVLLDSVPMIQIEILILKTCVERFNLMTCCIVANLIHGHCEWLI